MVRILGIDPGSRLLGYGVVAIAAGAGGRASISYVECGVIAVDPRRPLEERLAEMARGVGEVVAELKPTLAAVEDVYLADNARSALALGQARGAALAAIGMAGLPVTAYHASLVKKMVTGRGRATKEQVGHMVTLLLGLKRVPRADAADALAIAVAHAHARVGDWTHKAVTA